MISQEEPVRGMKNVLPALGLGAVIFLVFWPALTHDFVFDDWKHLPTVRDYEVESFGQMLSFLARPTAPGNLYRPTFMASLWLDRLLYKDSAWGFHFTNLILHILVTLCALQLFRSLANSWQGPLPKEAAIGRHFLDWPFMAALLFAVHPLHVEVVVSVAFRTESLQALFGLLALLAALQMVKSDHFLKTAGFAVISMLSLTLAQLSKESALVFLILIPLTIMTKLGPKPAVKAIPKLLPVLAVSALISLYLRHKVLDAIVVTSHRVAAADNFLAFLPTDERILNALVHLGRYLQLHFVPIPLRPTYSLRQITPLEGFGDLQTMLWVILLFSAVTTTLWGLLKRHPLGWSGAWFFASFALTCNILFPIGTLFAERLAYLPSLGVCSGLAFLLGQASWRFGRVLLAAIVLSWAVIAYRTSWHWHDEISFGEWMYSVSPQSALSHSRYGTLLLRAGRLEDAQKHYLRAMELSADSAQPAYGMSRVAFALKNEEGRLHWLQVAEQKDPNYTLALSDLGEIMLDGNEYNTAASYFVRVLNLNNHHIPAKLGLVQIYLARNQRAKAKELLEEILRDEPSQPEAQKLKEELLAKDTPLGE